MVTLDLLSELAGGRVEPSDAKAGAAAAPARQSANDRQGIFRDKGLPVTNFWRNFTNEYV